ncbi:class I SAM-dependent methyltransferase [Aquibaculum arenosum]|uniref:SAM-dependent methyltransferase n=1 Tax=Aquibaculum arenosum TaxID=3032591 RepID=A0ABT5YJD9_9PROT|nr:SAM-dependent methyltransferase [Fodinicurvata sp. CAU 1616]MDF2095032.1 SAM-dependent methyltransferase [Fodinicurvata sp. CAU 1616]
MSESATFEMIARHIRAEGPMSLANYMTLALTHPQVGYYATRDPFGAAGDFTTAPEISQVFGELLGLWCAERWQAMGEPSRIMLVELGPGRGTLMADALRAAALLPAFRAAIDLHLIENSPTLREAQARSLSPTQVTWHDTLSALPEGPLLLIANEFFDALPIRQFQRTAVGWAERRIGLSPDGQSLSWGLGASLPAMPELPQEAPEGAIREICPAARTIVADLARRVSTHGGAALIVDYGYTGGSAGDSLQALRHHSPDDPLAHPGDADITAHVDFQALAQAAAAAGAEVHGPVEQGTFLRALGICERSEALAAQATAAQRRNLLAALERLTSSAQMGSLFKALAFTPRAAPVPAGFPQPQEMQA